MLPDQQYGKPRFGCAKSPDKARGSAEDPIIIIPMTKSHYIMLKQNLLYTGITRAKKICILVGQKNAILKAVKNNDSKKRYTLLKDRLV